MQFKNIITFVSLAVMATALPAENLVERTTPAQDAQNKCTQTGATIKCCDSVQKTLLNLIAVPVGINCVNLDVLSVLPLSKQCSSSQKLACCSSGSQTGLVNIGNVCPQIL
ncbi:MAG: hypothetical protein Q9182_006065 [Xanthomendoza sp. 2 TL-2023]